MAAHVAPGVGMSSAGWILITGADGYLGHRMVMRLLQHTDHPLLLLLRADTPPEAAAKQQRLLAVIPVHLQARIRWHFANLAKPLDDIPVPYGDIHSIIHAAAVTRFNVSEAEANAVNRDGSVQMMQLARRCTALEKYVQIGTLYATGLQAGPLPEFFQTNAAGFANHYERSKHEAEAILLQEFNDLPWVLPRVATIVADDDSGKISQYNVFHNTLRLLFMGLTSIMPGQTTVPLYFVTSKFVESAVFALWQSKDAMRQIAHVCLPQSCCVTIGELIDLVFEEFAEDESFRKRRILKPLLTDYAAFSSLADTLDGMAGMVVRQALESMRPFAQQMFVKKEFSNHQLQQLWPGYRQSHQAQLLRQVVRQLLDTRWGSQPSANLSRAIA
jgi:nucleoside-diphosphate-sugar epimerase